MSSTAKKRRIRNTPVFTASELRANVGRVLEAATTGRKAVVIRRRGGHDAVLMSAAEYERLRNPLLEALRAAGEAAGRHGLDKMTMAEINAEIAAARRERRRRQTAQARS